MIVDRGEDPFHRRSIQRGRIRRDPPGHRAADRTIERGPAAGPLLDQDRAIADGGGPRFSRPTVPGL